MGKPKEMIEQVFRISKSSLNFQINMENARGMV